jgi:hypothetical protein
MMEKRFAKPPVMFAITIGMLSTGCAMQTPAATPSAVTGIQAGAVNPGATAATPKRTLMSVGDNSRSRSKASKNTRSSRRSKASKRSRTTNKKPIW